MQQPHLCYSFCHLFSHRLNHFILRRYDRRVVKELLGYLVTCVDTVTSPRDGWWHKCKEASFYPQEVQSVTFFCKGFVARIGTEWRDEREQRRHGRSEPHRPVEPWMKSRPTGRTRFTQRRPVAQWCTSIGNNVKASRFCKTFSHYVIFSVLFTRWDNVDKESGQIWLIWQTKAILNVCRERRKTRTCCSTCFLDTIESNCNSSKVRLLVLILAPERPLGVRRGETAPPVLEMCELQRN